MIELDDNLLFHFEWLKKHIIYTNICIIKDFTSYTTHYKSNEGDFKIKTRRQKQNKGPINQ